MSASNDMERPDADQRRLQRPEKADDAMETKMGQIAPTGRPTPIPMNRHGEYEDFLRFFTPVQHQLFVYLRAMIFDDAAANDVFQEVCLVMWRSFAMFDREADFRKWALGIARLQVLRYWRSRRRDRHIFTMPLIENLTERAADLVSEIDPRQQALNQCIRQLSKRQQNLVRSFYLKGLPAESIACEWARSVHAVYKALRVVRYALLECVERKLKRTGKAGPQP